MTSRTSLWSGWMVCLALVWSGTALAADSQTSAAPEPSREMRGQMAAIHRKMADCLASERPIADCRAEMQKNCQEMMGASGCPMMGGMGPGMMGGGRMHGPGMMQGGAPKQPSNP